MKVLLYLEGKSVLEKSGIGRALHHQMHALDLAGIPYTTDILGDYDVVHINTYGPRSLMLLHAAKRVARRSSCMVIRHVRTLRIHSSVLTFWPHFLGNIWPTCIKRPITWLHRLSIPKIDSVLRSYHTNHCCFKWDWFEKYGKDPRKEEVFRDYFGIEEGQSSGYLCGSLFPTARELKISSKVAERCLMFVSFG